METFIATIHVITALSLIALVLLQDSKGGGVGGAFGGGGSNSILGATGGATLAQKSTRIVAVIFAATSIGLTLMANKRSSVIDDMAPPAVTTPSATETGPTELSTTTTVPAQK